MNAIFCLSGKQSTHDALCRIINEMDIESLFVICRSEADLSAIEAKITERYFRNLGLTDEYPNKIGYLQMQPLDKAVLDVFTPYLYDTMKMYERLLDINSSFDERMQQIWKHLRYWNYIFDKYKIDLCVLQTVPHQIYDYILYALCKIKDIKITFIYENALLTHSYAITELNEHCLETKEEYERLSEKYKNSDITDILLKEEYQYTFDIQCDKNDANKVPYYIKNMKKDTAKVKVYNRHETTRGRIENLFNNFKENGVVEYLTKTYYPAYIKHRKYKKNLADMNFKIQQYFAYWESKCLDFDYTNKKYIYFPLHMQPECTTLPMGGWYSEQLFSINMIAYHLPKDVYVLVKEHPEQTMQNRSNSFIDELCAIENVRLVPKETSTFMLMDNCIAVSSITGTALWEGIFKNKPGIMFGNHIKQYAPGIIRVSTNDECKKAIETILNGEINITLKELKIFMLAMQNTSMPGNMSDVFPSTEQEMYKIFVHALEKCDIYINKSNKNN